MESFKKDVLIETWRNDQNPDESAEKINTSPNSQIRIRMQTSAPQISLYYLYYCNLFSRAIYRRSLFCRIGLLETFDILQGVPAIMIVR
jgi:hypothetical protein